MFHFDATDSDFHQPVSPPSPITRRPRGLSSSSQDETWVSPGFAGASSLVRDPSSIVVDITTRNAPTVAKGRRRSSVVIRGQGALLFIDEPGANSAAGTDDEGSNDRLKVDQGQEEKRKARSRSRKRKNKKNRNVSQSPAVIVDEGIVISSSSSVSTPKDAPSVND